jgi:CubicO group peptidase (beta-lactamase class C family)
MMLRGGGLGRIRILGEKGLHWLTRPCSPTSLPSRAFGWDMRSCSECLHRPSVLSQSAIGHSGWTGQSLWIDPELGLYVVVLTNRTHAQKNGAADTHGSAEVFRARAADIVLSHLGRVEGRGVKLCLLTPTL